ncbi:MAG: ATP-binding cassette domain-containing protein [Eubacteriales bacterium]|nr:ATP-binding cassette domain-containing protein [Eubacteriales bacterium]
MKLEVRNLTKTFGENEVLHGISFEVESGSALGLLGRNGAGKTTTIRIIMDVFHANSGEVYLDGEKFNPKKHIIGYLPEERGLYPKKTVLEQLVYLARIRGVSKARAIENTKKWLKRLEIDEYINRKLETLSKGNQQKVQLASTLVCEPAIVILDEPFSGLDPVNSKILQDVVKEIIEDGKLVIFSSHQMSYVEEFCDNIVIINKGDVALSGRLDDIKREFGKNQLVVSDEQKSLDELESLLADKLNGDADVTGRTKDALILRNTSGLSKNELINKIISCGVNIEHFETYKPSLNDIFVATAGDSEKEGL